MPVPTVAVTPAMMPAAAAAAREPEEICEKEEGVRGTRRVEDRE